MEMILGKNYDTLTITYPSSTVVVFTYTMGSGVVKTIKYTYSDATRDNLLTQTA